VLLQESTLNRRHAIAARDLLAGCEKLCWSGAAARRKDRKIEDKKMKRNPIFLSSIFLSVFLALSRPCGAAFIPAPTA
jgi:hypothetical protein